MGLGEESVRAEVGAGDVVLFDRGEQHAKRSDTGMTAVVLEVEDIDPAMPLDCDDSLAALSRQRVVFLDAVRLTST